VDETAQRCASHIWPP